MAPVARADAEGPAGAKAKAAVAVGIAGDDQPAVPPLGGQREGGLD